MIGLRTKETKGSQAGPVVPFLDKIESPCFAMINDTIGLLIDGYHYFDEYILTLQTVTNPDLLN